MGDINMRRRQFLRLTSNAVAVGLVTRIAPVAAQFAKQIRIVVPFPAGGRDAAARPYAG